MSGIELPDPLPGRANALFRLRGEIARSLESVRRDLENYLSADCDDPRPLLSAADQLGQVAGIVAVIQCFGASVLTDEMCELVDALVAGRVDKSEQVFSALSMASLQLSDYIELLVSGQADCAAILLPVLNELRVARAAPLFTEAGLFEIQVSAALAAMPRGIGEPEQREAADVQTVARRELAFYQQHFVNWFKGRQAESALAAMRDTAAQVAAAAEQPALRRVWWVLGLLMEALGSADAPQELRRLLGRSGVELKCLAVEGEFAAARSTDAMLGQTLYWLARQADPPEPARDLLNRLDVQRLLPDAETLAQAQERLQRVPNLGVLAQLQLELQRELQAVKDAIDLRVRTHGRSGGDLGVPVAGLERIADTLSVLGLSALQHVLRNQAQRLPMLAADAPEWMDVALALVRVETGLHAALAHVVGRTDGGQGSPVEAEPAAIDVRAEVSAVAKQALASLSDVETALSLCVDQGAARHLAGLDTRVADVSASLRVAGLEDFSEQLDGVAHYLASEHAARITSDPAASARLADAMASVDFYLEGVRDGLPNVEPLLERVIACVAPLLDELAAPADGVVAIEAAPPPEAVASRTATEADGAAEPVDPELVEVFVEEAEQVVESLKADLRRIKQTPQDTEALGEFRRGFHTLKGSGRMVGATGIGEFAWAVEQLLNRCLDGSLAVQTPILDVAEQAAGLVPRMIAALKQGDSAAATVPEAVELAARADELRQGPDDAGGDLYELFRNDAVERLSLLASWLAEQKTDSAAVAVEPEIERVFHTLRGSAAVCGATPVQHIGAAVEDWLHKLRQASQTLTAADCALLGDTGQALGRWIAPAGLAPAAEVEADALLVRLRQQQAEATASAPAPVPSIDHDAYTLEALQQLQEIETDIKTWQDDSRPDYGPHVGARFENFAAAATAHACPALAETGTALAQGLNSVSAPPAAALFPALEDVLEQLYQRLDALREGLPEADPAALLDQIAGLPVVGAAAPWTIREPTPEGVSAESVEAEASAAPGIPGDRVRADTATPTPTEDSASVDAGEIQTMFDEEARELLGHCRSALHDLAVDSIDQAALLRLRRSLHTLKGSARMVGRADLGQVAARAAQRLPAGLAVAGELPLASWQGDCNELERLLGGDTGGSGDGESGIDGKASTDRVVDTVTDDIADVPQAVPAGLDPGLLGIFAAEAGELLDDLDAALVHREAVDSTDRVRRALHTLKGSAYAAGLDSMGNVVHELENRIERLVPDGADTPLPHAPGLQRGVDELHALHAALRRGNYAALLSEPVAIPAAEEASPWQGELLWQPPDQRGENTTAYREHARVSIEALDRMLGEAGELGTQRERLVEHNAGVNNQLAEFDRTVERLRTQLHMLVAETDAQIAARGLNTDADRYAEDFDPLEMDRYSRMQELSRTLSEAVDDLGVLHDSMERAGVEVEAMLGQQAQTTAAVQQGLMDALLVPFSSQQAWLERVVRQTAVATEKRAALIVSGADTELDRTVLERIAGPLEHLVRNAVVHGIELPAARSAVGKPAEGRVDLRLWRETGQVVIEVSDDGRGLDFEAIRTKAVARDLLAPDAEVGEAELARLIFEPGFSTAASLTGYAGRGVGLDVVNSSVRQLGGTLDVQARKGEPLAFVLRLPVSLALSRMLLVQVGGERYTLPLTGIAGIARIPSADLAVRLEAGSDPVEYGGTHYTVRYLGDFLDLPRPAQVEERSVVAILVQTEENLEGEARCAALVVDELLGVQEIMAKVSGPQLGQVVGVAGAATLPDGGVAITLDLPALVGREQLAGTDVAVAATQPKAATIMVVDDSITMRRIATRLLEHNGYRVVTARDGLDAMDRLQEETPKVVLLDIEMPRADGFEVAAFMRDDARLAEIPIIMITSRSGDKHRARASALGVRQYLVKPYQESQLLQEIQRLQGDDESLANE